MAALVEGRHFLLRFINILYFMNLSLHLLPYYQKQKTMTTTNFKKRHIIKYANQVGLINSTCKETGYSIILSDRNEVNSNSSELEGIPLSKDILEIIGFKQFGDKSYISNFLQGCKKSELGYDYPRLTLGYLNRKMTVSVFFHKVESPNDKSSCHFIEYLHELQDVYKNLGYTISFSPQMLINIQKSIE